MSFGLDTRYLHSLEGTRDGVEVSVGQRHAFNTWELGLRVHFGELPLMLDGQMRGGDSTDKALVVGLGWAFPPSQP